MTNEIELLIKNGKIITLNPIQPEVESIAINEGKIIALGDSIKLTKIYSPSKTIDLKGHFLCPGFNDAHTHLIAISATFQDIQLDKVTSPKKALALIEEQVKNSSAGKWVFGHGWDESNWDDKRYLSLDELDAVAPKNPCFIRRVCGHLAAVNSLALKELEINFNDPELQKNPTTNKPIGIITDSIIDRISNSPKLKKTQEEMNNAVNVACEYAYSLGVTSVTDNLSIYGLKAYINAWKKGFLGLRINANIPLNSFHHYIESGLQTGFGDEFLRLGGVKIFTDGSLGARTAALKEPYFDDPSTSGSFYIERSELFNSVNLAVKNCWQTAIHAIGDQAIDLVLDAFESLKSPDLIVKGRHRIEHAEYLSHDQMLRAKKLGLILSMQPNFPGRWGQPGQLYEIRLGSERYKQLNNFKKILNTKVKLCFGSDNMPMSPLFGIYSVVTHPVDNIRISVEEALFHFTLGSAFASFEEEIKGSIEEGKLADFVVLDKDLLKVSQEEIKDIKILMTIFNGKVVYNKLS